MLEEVRSCETLNYSIGSNEDFTRMDHEDHDHVSVLNDYFT